MTCLHNIRYKKLYDNKVFPLGSTEKLLSSTQNYTFSNPRRYAFLLKEAKNFGKMFEGEGDFTDVHLVKDKQTCYEGNFFDNTSSSSFTVSGASLDDSGFSKQF